MRGRRHWASSTSATESSGSRTDVGSAASASVDTGEGASPPVVVGHRVSRRAVNPAGDAFDFPKRGRVLVDAGEDILQQILRVLRCGHPASKEGKEARAELTPQRLRFDVHGFRASMLWEATSSRLASLGVIRTSTNPASLENLLELRDFRGASDAARIGVEVLPDPLREPVPSPPYRRSRSVLPISGPGALRGRRRACPETSSPRSSTG